MAGLKDWLGRAVDLLSLTNMLGGPQPGGVRQVRSGHPADGMTPVRLSRILRSAAEGEPEAFFELAEDIEERDPHYLSVLATRKRSVAQLPITVKPASDSVEHKKHAALVQSWIDDGVLRASLFDMLDAIGKGLSVLEVDWQYRMGSMLPRELIYRPQRWFTFDREDGETVLLREGVSGEPLVPHKFIVHRHKSKSGLTIRSGLARVAMWSWMFKSFTVKDWAIFCQNYGQPIRIGKYGRGATEAEKDVLWRAVSGIAGDCAAIVPREMLIEFHEVGSKSSSTDMYERRADWLDRQISKLVLGQTTTTDAVSGGHAVSKEHRLVQEDIERDDAGMVTATLCQQLIPNIVAFNFGPQEHYPHVRIGRPDEVPLGEFAEAFSKLAPLGLTADESFLQERLGIPAAKAGAVMVGGRVAVSPSVETSGQKPIARNDVQRAFDGLFLSAHARSNDPEAVLKALSQRLEDDAASAMDGMIDEVRKVLMQARDLRDAADQLARLDLSADDLAEAMARGMALAHLAGQASLLDDIKGGA
ncbi:phage gp29-like protein [Agrobacterium vitis]|nr:phage gp29-like protein [Agrobacterium vitis]MBE1439838.1 phage gp29-like protein [Agrobacterium vitis]